MDRPTSAANEQAALPTAAIAAARGVQNWHDRRRLEGGAPPAPAALDTLVRVAVATRDATLFGRVQSVLPPMASAGPWPPARTAWARGDAHFDAERFSAARWWWSAALRFDDLGREQVLAQFDFAYDEGQPALVRARTLMAMTVATEARCQSFFFDEGAMAQLDQVLTLAPDYLPAQILRAAQAYTLHDHERSHALMLRYWPAAVAAGLRPEAPPSVAADAGERLRAWQAVAAWWAGPLLLPYACAVGASEAGDRASAERQARSLISLEPAAAAPCDLLAQLCEHGERWPEARDAWRLGLLRDGSRPQPWLHLAALELEQGDGQAGEDALRHYLELSPDTPAANQLNIGYQLALRPGLANARGIEAFERVATADGRTDEDELNALINLGIARRANDEPLAALMALSEARDRLPEAAANQPALALPIARCLQEVGNPAAAAAAFGRHLAEHGDDPAVAWEMLQAMVDAGQMEEARACLDRQAARSPTDATNRRQLGKGFLAVRALPAALRWLEPLQQEDDSVDTLLALMEALEGLDRPEQAARLAESHVERGRPLTPTLFERWARALMQGERHEQALVACDRGLAAFPVSASLLFHKAMVLGARGDMDASVQVVHATLRLDPDHAQALEWVARLPADARSPLSPLACSTRLLALTPDDAGLAMRLAIQAHEADQPELALHALETAVESGSTRAMALHLRGYILRDQGDWAAACEVFEAALEAAPEEPSLWRELASTRAALEEWDAAEACWRRAQALEPDNEDDAQALAQLAAQREARAAGSPAPSP